MLQRRRQGCFVAGAAAEGRAWPPTRWELHLARMSNAAPRFVPPLHPPLCARAQAHLVLGQLLGGLAWRAGGALAVLEAAPPQPARLAPPPPAQSTAVQPTLPARLLPPPPPPTCRKRHAEASSSTPPLGQSHALALHAGPPARAVTKPPPSDVVPPPAPAGLATPPALDEQRVRRDLGEGHAIPLSFVWGLLFG